MLAIVVALSALVLIGTVNIVVYLRAIARAKKIDALFKMFRIEVGDGRTLKVFVAYNTSENDVKLHQAVSVSVGKLKTVWGFENVLIALENVRILIREDNDWIDVYGRHIGGAASGNLIVIGADFTALCHELAHVCELAIDHTVDDDHFGWSNKGIALADLAYREWLSKS